MIDARISKGMQLAADLPDIMPSDAAEQIRPVYEEIQRTLRVPFVNLIFRALANYPDYLVQAWAQVAPVASTYRFERAADDLRLRACLPDAPERVLIDVADAQLLRGFNDTIHYVLPKLLLVATLLDPGAADAALRSQVEGGGSPDGFPSGVAEGTTKVQMLDPQKAEGRVAELFESIKSRHGHPLVSSYYRALGAWPDVLDCVWSRLEPWVGSEPYEARVRELVAAAETHAASLRGSARCSEPTGENAAEIGALLAAFRCKFIPEMLVDVAAIKAMLDGPEAAAKSPFSLGSCD